MRAAASVTVLAACGHDPLTTVPDPGANLAIVTVQFSQAVQDLQGTVPLIEGSPAVAIVTIARSRDTLESSVPVVLRLFRSGVLVRSDTARTAGPLNPSTSLNNPTVQFLIPGSVVTGALSWQIEIDPGQTQPDSTRSDNKVPAAVPAPLNVVTIPPFRIRFVPITLGANGNTTGNVTTANVEDYLRSVHQLLPVGQVIATVGTPLTTQISFGAPPIGGDRVQFWFGILAEVSLAQAFSRDADANWYGIVGFPPGFTDAFFGGIADIGVIRSGVIVAAPSAAVSLDLNAYTPGYARLAVAHELGHNFGMNHAPGCNAFPPVDPLYPNVAGVTVYSGFDVWSWSAGLLPRAQSYDGGNFDLMSYCRPNWISLYTYQAILNFRMAVAAAVTHTVRAPAIIVQGSLSLDGSVTLLPAVEGEAVIPAPGRGGDITVDARDANGVVLATTRVMSSAIDHVPGTRRFLAILPAAKAATATRIVARSRAGHVAVRDAASGTPTLRVRRLAGDVIDVQSDTSRAVILRDDVTGDVLAIGWSGHATVSHAGPVSASLSNGVRSQRVTRIVGTKVQLLDAALGYQRR
jgi:hypothetical protein